MVTHACIEHNVIVKNSTVVEKGSQQPQKMSLAHLNLPIDFLGEQEMCYFCFILSHSALVVMQFLGICTVLSQKCLLFTIQGTTHFFIEKQQHHAGKELLSL